jgi:Na+:H+ antiporter, NhaA family
MSVTVAGSDRLGRLPDGMNRTHLAGLGLITGLGFTVALFITDLAYTDPKLTDRSKIGVLAASAFAATASAAVLATANKRANRSAAPNPDTAVRGGGA